ncbi:MAG TPA: ABC transporter substrate-binding protein [Gemmatimonadaceae bacterium]|nr:ABC transporter substrate-binding protein [Gemmatimonadaceae bacterium]
MVYRHFARALFTCVFIVGCRGGDANPARHTLIDSRDRYDPKSLDPAHANDIPSGRLVSDLFDGLTRVGQDGTLQPGVAERWELSPDGLTYTFHLRPHVQFHDGRVLSARTVVASMTRALAPETKGIPLWPLYPIDGAREFASGKAASIAGLRATDDSTLTIKLGQPLAVFPKLLAMPIAAIVPESVGTDFSEHPIGTGPWRFVEWKHDDYIRLAKNPAYFDGVAKADSFEARIIPEPSTAVAEFESGNVDLLYVPEGETQQWQQTDEHQALLKSPPPLRLIYAAFNTTRGPLVSAQVRQAINYAVDRKKILEQLLAGRGRLAAGVVPPSLPGADTTRAPYPFDPARAKQLLAAAGHAHDISLELWCALEPPFPQVAQSIQAYLTAVGIKVTIVQRENNSLREAARNGKTDIVLKDWYADYIDAENFLYPLLASANVGQGGNVSFYSNPQFDHLITSARAESNENVRTREYKQADSIAFADAPMLFLVFYNELYAVQPWLRGFQPPVIFNAQRWTDVEIAH